MAKRFLCIMLVLSLLPLPAISSGMEYMQMTDAQLLEKLLENK